ncbi:annexin D5-like isoform X1 [Primulina huaijiensis]|uniref:annexin D5-like isoform X1 n=1 Tax=Primulina huaijiensis TaxID=1492673 RepID=UPI003CC7428F
MATLSVAPMLTSPRDDAMQLYRAFKGLGCDTTAVVKILAHRDATQRALIEQEYKAIYSEELNKRLASELSGDVKSALLLRIPDPAGRDAIIVRQSLAADTIINLKAATEVICSRTPSQLQFLTQVSRARFHAYVEHDFECHASGDHKELMLAYLNTIRYEGTEVDWAMAEQDATSLYKAGEKRVGTDENTFIRIFCERSRAHLAAVSSAYNRLYGRSLEKVVKSETSGNFEFALLTVLRCAENPGKYFAKVLHKAMKGMGTDESTLTRVIVTRTEIDMQYIKAEYHKKYGNSLNDAVQSETTRHYRAFLLELLGPTHH